MPCTHRDHTGWARIWDVWLAVTVGSFAAIEITAIARDGIPATLSFYLRRAAGLEQHCRHQHAGRAVILAGLSWAAVHLGWGVLGVRGPRK